MNRIRLVTADRAKSRLTPQPETRILAYQNMIIPYNVIRSQRAKNLRLSITSGSILKVIVPPKFSIKEAESFLDQKKDWVLKHYNSELPAEGFFLFGKSMVVSQSFDLFMTKHSVLFKNNELKVISPSDSGLSQEQLYNAWLKHYAKIYLPARVSELAEKYGFNLKKVTVRSQQTRWGSCSSNGNVSFNYRLMKFRKEVIDYVIVHELCHLKELNHSPRFWKLVEDLCPRYKELKQELKKANPLKLN